MSNNNAGAEVEAAMMVVDDQLALPQNNSNDQPTEPNGNEGNEGAEAGNEVEEMVVEERGENQPASNGTTVTGSTSRYSLRKRSRKPLQSILDNTAGEGTAGSGSKSNGRGKQPDVFGYISSAALTDREFEKLLAHHEERGVHERAQKKLRLERGYADDDYPYEPPAEGCPAFDSLPKEAIQLVFELLPSVRAVFNLAYQSKYMLSFVEERTDIVVRAAVMGDALSNRAGENDERKTLRVIMNEVRKRSILVPSTLRLLRLLCAKRCERGINCWAYDLKTELSSIEGVSAGSRPFGLSLCKTCCMDVGHNFRYYNRIWANWEDKDKIAIHRWSRVICFSRAADILTTAGGEEVGPLIEAKDLKHISVAHREPTDRKDAFNGVVAERYGEVGSEERTSFEEGCSELVGMFDDAEDELTTWLLELQNEKQEELARKHEEALAKKKESIEPILTALETAVADVPLKELALDFRHQGVSSEAVRFRYFFMREAMGKLIKAPSSASPKTLAAALSSVKWKLTILSSSDDFFSLSFLSDAIEASTNSREKRILQKMLDQARHPFHSMKFVMGSHQGSRAQHDLNNTNGRFFDLLEQQEYTTALLHVLEARGDLKGVVASVLVSSTSSDPYNHRRLARAVFLKVDKERPREADGTLPGYTLESFKSTVSDARREFLTLKTRARDYLNHQRVLDWVEGNPEQYNYQQARLRRKSSTKEVWHPRATFLNRRYSSENNFIWNDIRGVSPYQLLMDQDFDRLLRVHQFYNGWGGAFNNHYDAQANT